jgi:hypothetical protein
MTQLDDLSIMRKMLDGIVDLVAYVVFDIIVEVVIEGLFYIVDLCI